MHFSSRQLHAFGATLATCAVLGGAQQGAGQELGSYGWYVSVSGGTNWNPVMKQAGDNRDNICYPNDLCDGTPGGYRWFYDLPSDLGTAFEIAIGRNFGGVRLAVSASQRSNNIKQEFTDITFRDGSPILPNVDSNYTSTSKTSVDALATRTLSLNAYHDFSLAENRIMPYLGAGLGLSSIELTGLSYVSASTFITALREAEVGLARGKSVKLMSRELGITEQTYYRWRREYGGMKVSQARRLKELERENGRLKRAVADLTLDKLILEEAAEGNF